MAENLNVKCITIEVAYVAADQSTFHRTIDVVFGTTVAGAIEQSGILQNYPEVSHCAKGIFSQLAEDDRILESGDRVECYRPLLIDPKAKRRMRSKNRTFRKPGF